MWDAALAMSPRPGGEAPSSAGEIGQFDCTVSAAWNVGSAPNGGYLHALAGAAAQRMQPFSHAVIASTFYLSAAAPGPAQLEATLVRRGRTTATVSTRLVQGGKERLRHTATFADLAAPTASPQFIVGHRPDCPPPEACEPLASVLPSGVLVNLAASADVLVAPPGEAIPGAPREAHGWFRFRDGRDPDPGMLALAVDAYTPVVFDLTDGGWAPTLQLTLHTRADPAPGWLCVARRTTLLAGGYADEDAEVWDAAGRLVALGRQVARMM